MGAGASKAAIPKGRPVGKVAESVRNTEKSWTSRPIEDERPNILKNFHVSTKYYAVSKESKAYETQKSRENAMKNVENRYEVDDLLMFLNRSRTDDASELLKTVSGTEKHLLKSLYSPYVITGVKVFTNTANQTEKVFYASWPGTEPKQAAYDAQELLQARKEFSKIRNESERE